MLFCAWYNFSVGSSYKFYIHVWFVMVKVKKKIWCPAFNILWSEMKHNIREYWLLYIHLCIHMYEEKCAGSKFSSLFACLFPIIIYSWHSILLNPFLFSYVRCSCTFLNSHCAVDIIVPCATIQSQKRPIYIPVAGLAFHCIACNFYSLCANVFFFFLFHNHWLKTVTTSNALSFILWI